MADEVVSPPGDIQILEGEIASLKRIITHQQLVLASLSEECDMLALRSVEAQEKSRRWQKELENRPPVIRNPVGRPPHGASVPFSKVNQIHA